MANSIWQLEEIYKQMKKPWYLFRENVNSETENKICKNTACHLNALV